MDIVGNPVTMQVVSIVVAGVCGFLAAQVKRMAARDRALYEGMKTMLRKEIIDSYERYFMHGEPLSYMRRDEIDRCYAAYKELGGNGTGETLYQKILKLNVYTIVDKEDNQ